MSSKSHADFETLRPEFGKKIKPSPQKRRNLLQVALMEGSCFVLIVD